jgi:hypothetical protein
MMPTGGEGYWNSMLGGYATSRYSEEAFEHSERSRLCSERQFIKRLMMDGHLIAS